MGIYIRMTWPGETQGVIVAADCPHRAAEALEKRLPHLSGVVGEVYSGPIEGYDPEAAGERVRKRLERERKGVPV